MSKREWTVMTRTRGGVVSVMNQLTEDEARGVMQRLRRPFDRGNPWVLEERVALERLHRQHRREMAANGQLWFNGLSGGSRLCSDADLEQIDCWSASGAELDVWPKPADWDERWAAAMVEVDAWEAALPPVEPPPPPKPPRAPELGLPDVLRVESERGGPWRCTCCNKMQDATAEGVWIPDSIQKRDSRDDLIKVAKAQRWNGHASMWCVPCCGPWREVVDASPKKRGFWG